MRIFFVFGFLLSRLLFSAAIETRVDFYSLDGGVYEDNFEDSSEENFSANWDDYDSAESYEEISTDLDRVIDLLTRPDLVFIMSNLKLGVGKSTFANTDYALHLKFFPVDSEASTDLKAKIEVVPAPEHKKRFENLLLRNDIYLINAESDVCIFKEQEVNNFRFNFNGTKLPDGIVNIFDCDFIVMADENITTVRKIVVDQEWLKIKKFVPHLVRRRN